MNRDTIIEVFKHYTVESILTIENIQRGVTKITTTSDKKYIIINTSLESIKKQYEVLSRLKQLHVPVAPVLLTLKGMYFVEMKNTYYCMYPFVDGIIIENLYGKGGEDIVSSLGKSIAILHQGLKQLSFNKDFSSDDFFSRTFDDGLYSIRMYEKGSNIISRVEGIVLECKSLQSKLNELPVQMIHGDMHSGNIIYGDKTVNAFIDFELCTTGYKVYDLGFLMVDILMQGFPKVSDKQWLFLCNKLIEGYNKPSALSELEMKTLCYILLAALFLIIGYFYRKHEFDEAKKYLEALFWIYNNRDKINEALMG